MISKESLVTEDPGIQQERPMKPLAATGASAVGSCAGAQQVIGMTRRLEGHDQLTRSF
jgi:hypothetical protein